jgi:hypothetical protein
MENINENMEIDTQFNVIKSKVDEMDMRAYIYQCMFEFENNNSCFQAVNKLQILSDEQMSQWRWA